MSFLRLAGRTALNRAAQSSRTRIAPICLVRNASSMSAEGQQKVCEVFDVGLQLVNKLRQLLSADLEHADPAVYGILQKVR